MFISKLKFISCLCIVTSSTFLVLSHEKLVRSAGYISTASSEDTYVRYAFKAIQQQLAQKTGSVERISCVYKFFDNKPISVTVKTHYLTYRKKPDCCEIYLNNEANSEVTPDYSLEVIYHPTDKNHLALVSKDPKKNNKRLDSRSIEISSLSI